MNDALSGTERPASDARPSAVVPSVPIAAPGEGGSKLVALAKLVAGSAALAILSGVAGLLVAVALGALFTDAIKPGFEAKAWAATALGQLFLGALTLWRASRRFGPDWRAQIGLRTARFDRALWGRVILALVVYWVWAVLVLTLASLWGGLRLPPDLLPRGPLGYAAFALTAVVLAPLCEEAFFRGYVQARAQTFLSPLVSILVPALLFALAHFSGTLVQPAVVFGLGVLAGGLRRVSGSLIPGMVLHAVNNGFLVLLLAFAHEKL